MLRLQTLLTLLQNGLSFHELADLDPPLRTKAMKHLLSGTSIAAALVIATAAWAQGPSPSGGNPMGMPGPNPGGPGLTQYSTGQTQSSATPPAHHRQARHARHAMQRTTRGPALTGSTADQLNQGELARLQAGNFANPAAPPAPGTASSGGMAMPGPGEPGHVMGPKAATGGTGFVGAPGPGHVTPAMPGQHP
jgi:hypothetical protein